MPNQSNISALQYAFMQDAQIIEQVINQMEVELWKWAAWQVRKYLKLTDRNESGELKPLPQNWKKYILNYSKRFKNHSF